MNDIVIFFLLFLDLDWDNLFSSNDKLLEINNNNYVYCETIDTKEYKPCWYYNLSDEVLFSKEFENNMDKKDLIFDRLYFSNEKSWSTSYLYFIDWKYVFSNEKLNWYSKVYYSDNKGIYEKESINKILMKITIIIAIILGVWFLLLPKKEYLWTK